MMEVLFRLAAKQAGELRGDTVQIIASSSALRFSSSALEQDYLFNVRHEPILQNKENSIKHHRVCL